MTKIEGLSDGAPKLAEHVFDAGVMSGPRDAGIWLQQSLDEVSGTNLGKKAKNGKIEYIGRVYREQSWKYKK